MSAVVPKDLQWMVLRKGSSFRHKQRGIHKTFSRERLNLKGLHSARYSGLAQHKAVGVEPAADGKGVILTVRNKRERKPVSAGQKIALTKHGRKTLKTIKNIMVNGKYRPELNKLAQRRASQLLRSQRPVSAKRTRKIKKTVKSE